MLAPSWPKKAAGAIAALFRPLQDITVYVEDADDEVFYRELLRRLVPNVRIARVVGLHGRSYVLAACEAHDFSKHRALFLVDGDLLFAFGVKEQLPAGAVRLPAYCIENFLICRQAALELLYQNSGTETKENLEKRLSWDTWVRTLSPLVELFAVYATAKMLTPREQTVQYSVHRLCTAKPARLVGNKIEERRSEILGKIRMTCTKEIADSHLEQAETWAMSLPQPLDIVSGKDYLLPMLRKHLCSIVHIGARTDSIRLRLAQHCDCERLRPLALALECAAKGGTPNPLLEQGVLAETDSARTL